MGESEGMKVKVDGEDAILHITEQSVMFEKEGNVSGFERSAIRMVKPDGDTMFIAYSSGTKVESIRVEPMTAVSSLLVPEKPSASRAKLSGFDEVFEKLYWDTRKELEEKLVKVETEPQDKALRLTAEERQKYFAVRNQMTYLAGAKYGANPEGDEPLLTFWGLETRPPDFQVSIVKIMHINFLLGVVSPKAETEDVTYHAYQVWPADWPNILKQFGLGESKYTDEKFSRYVSYLKSHWQYGPSARRPALVSELR